MKNNIRHWLVLRFGTFSIIAIIHAVLGGVPASVEKFHYNPPAQRPPKGVRHPLRLTPEDTLRTILEAYIARDIETVLAYLPPVIRENPERMAQFREIWSSYMTDERHVKRIVEIRLDKITSVGEDKVARLWAKIETTPRFSGAPDLGGNIREYRWALRQLKGKGPWFHDGGGF